MRKTNKSPRELLKKGHAHKSKKDYDRKRMKGSDEWSDHFPLPHMKIINKKGPTND